MAQSTPNRFPLFYKTPTPLEADKHAALKLRSDGGYAFAKGAMAVPITLSEFALCVRHYPIVFAGVDDLQPLAIMGLKDNENLFVDKDGRWDDGTYIPAYIRRYPFIFVEVPEQDKLVLCIDEASDLITNADGQPMFEDGKPSETVGKALQLCQSMRNDHAMTETFVAAVNDAGILTDQNAKAVMNSGEEMAVEGFKVVDEKGFQDMPDETYLDWRKAGWVGFVYLHLASTHNWGGLVDRFKGEDA